MSVHHLARTRSLYCPSRRVPRSSDLSLTAMQACSGWCPPPTHRLLNAPSDLHRPLRRTKCTTIPNGVCFQYLFLTTSPIHLHLYISRWESPPYTSTQFSVPDNWKSGRIWVRIFSPALSPLVPGCIPADVLRARTRASFLVGFQGRRDCNFTTTSGVNSCLDGGCNGGLQCDPHTGTVRLSPTIFTYTQTHTSSLSPLPSLSPFLSLGALQGVPPATVAEWTLQSNNSQDFYDGARMSFLPIPHLLIRKRPD